MQKFGLEMLDMADNLARAAEAVPEEYREENPDDGSNPIAKVPPPRALAAARAGLAVCLLVVLLLLY